MRARLPFLLMVLALAIAGLVVLDAVIEQAADRTPAPGAHAASAEIDAPAPRGSRFRSLRAASADDTPSPGLLPGAATGLEPVRARQALAGSPPWIPHPVPAEMATGEVCLTCHRYGGWAPPYQAWAPATPHPELASCQQCHVARTVEGAWPHSGPGDAPPEPVAATPPRRPHELYEGLECLDCHGPDGDEEIQTRHPERPGCSGCHLPAEGS